MTRLNDYFLASNVAAKVFYSPDGGQKGFFTIGELNLHTAERPARICHDSFVCVVLMHQSRTQTVG